MRAAVSSRKAAVMRVGQPFTLWLSVYSTNTTPPRVEAIATVMYRPTAEACSCHPCPPAKGSKCTHRA